jgi:hypothetical protein
MRATVATLLLLLLAFVAKGGEARAGDGLARQLLTGNPEPPSCKDSNCDKALKYGCEWLPKAELKCDAGGKHKVSVKNCFKDKVDYISISIGDKCYKGDGGDVLAKLELKCGDEITIYGYDKHLKGDGSTACSEDSSRKANDYCKTCKYTAKYDCGHPDKPGDLCRKAYGDCDKPEYYDHYCHCPYDGYKDDKTICRPSVGPCDKAEYCTGKSANCPYDKYEPHGKVCRKSDGECDVPEYCTGKDAKCPYDEFLPKTTLCRKAYGKCDKPEYCTGDKAKCPKDEFKPKGELCRGKYGDCDVADYCDGYSPKCEDKVEKKGTVCRKAAGPCDAEEKCDGYSKRCPKDYCVDYRKELKEPYCPVKII